MVRNLAFDSTRRRNRQANRPADPKDLDTEERTVYLHAALVATLIECAWPQRHLGEAAVVAARRRVSTQHPWAKGLRLKPSQRRELGQELLRHTEERQTARQIEGIDCMHPGEVLDLAKLALHALNRRAKHLRWDRDRAAGIYALKNRYLRGCVFSGRYERVEHYRWSTQTGWYCPCCDREWGGRHNDVCYDCGSDAELAYTEADWYIIDLGGQYRFHQPGNTLDPSLREKLAAVSVEIEAHDPTQPAREVPAVGLTEAAQVHCVTRAVQILEAAGSGKQATSNVLPLQDVCQPIAL